MVFLNDRNIVYFRDEINYLSNNISSLQTELMTAEKELNSSTGATFRTDYTKGKKAFANITSIIDILQSLEKDLKTLRNDTFEYWIRVNDAINHK